MRLPKSASWKTTFAILLTASALVLFDSCSEKPPETAEWDGYKLREVRTLSALPHNLQNTLDVGRAGLDGIADRGGKFNPTDVVDSSLPMRRFLVAGLENDSALVAIERGGQTYGVEVTLFTHINDDAKVERTWTLFPAPRTLRALVDRLATSKPQ